LTDNGWTASEVDYTVKEEEKEVLKRNEILVSTLQYVESWTIFFFYFSYNTKGTIDNDIWGTWK